MNIITGIILTICSLFYCNNKIKSIKLSDFEEEDKRLKEEGLSIPEVKCEEMRIGIGLKSDNYLMIFFSILILIVFMCIKGNVLYTALFTPIIPLLISLFIIDLRMKRIPDCFAESISVFSIIYLVIMMVSNNSILIVYSNVMNSLLLFLIYFIIAVVTGGMLGGGDIKLISVIGLLFTTNNFPQFLIYPFFIGTLQAIVLMLFKKKKGNDMFAFAPSIIISTFIIVFI